MALDYLSRSYFISSKTDARYSISDKHFFQFLEFCLFVCLLYMILSYRSSSLKVNKAGIVFPVLQARSAPK